MRRFSVRSLFKVVALAVVLVLAVDYASFAATGQGAILGRLNKANRVTTFERTTPGPALKLVTKPGSAPLAVNRPVKVAGLNADRLDGLDSTQLSRRPQVTALETHECATLPAITTTFQKITDLAAFTKRAGNTLVRLDVANRFRVDSATSTGVIFELRVDNAPTTVGTANMLLRSPDYATNVQHPLFGVFSGLAAGNHTVSLWARTNTGSGSNAQVDPGCWNSADVNQLLVTEF